MALSITTTVAGVIFDEGFPADTGDMSVWPASSFDDGRRTTADDFKNCRRTDRGYPFTRVNCPTSEMPRRKKSEHPVR